MEDVHYQTMQPRMLFVHLQSDKNWLFADTPKGATASDAVCSIVETAKANGLNVYVYLQHLLLYMPGSDWHNHPEELDDLMPWSEDVQERCK